MGGWAVLIGLANISHVAWRAQQSLARAWLPWLLCELLAVTAVPADSPSPSIPCIMLTDATRLKQPGSSGDDWQLDVGAWLRQSQGGTQSRVVAFDDQRQRFRGRLIACALTALTAERARD